VGIVEVYRNQFRWRDWQTAFDAVPLEQGQTVLDLGCGVGALAEALLARGAGRVVGVDGNQELLDAARARGLPGLELHRADLAALPDFSVTADGFWCSFTAAYFPDLTRALRSWARALRPGGWIAITEVDDLFGHAPLAPSTVDLLSGYAREALSAGRYDFHMGRNLRSHLERAGFAVISELVLADRELAADGSVSREVLEAWRLRLSRMKLLQAFCGDRYEELESDFLGCLSRADHRATARVMSLVALSPLT
jgi:ubiquinone/menaquinone biosynthesis C-methylase UbiE